MVFPYVTYYSFYMYIFFAMCVSKFFLLKISNYIRILQMNLSPYEIMLNNIKDRLFKSCVIAFFIKKKKKMHTSSQRGRNYFYKEFTSFRIYWGNINNAT